MTTYNETISENVTNSGTMLSLFSAVISEDVEITQSETITALANIIEDVYLSDILSTAAILGWIVTDTTQLNDLIRIALQAVISEDLTNSDDVAEVIQRIYIISELLEVLDTTTTKYTSTVALAVALTVADLINQLDIITEDVAISDSFIELLSMSINLISNLELSDTQAEFITFLHLVDDIVDVDDTYSLQSTYHKLLSENIQIIIGSSILDDTYSGWVINPENYAVSKYSNYSFNSNTFFNNEYLYCSPSGLYRIGGTLDEEDYITSRIKTAAMSFGTSSLKQVPEVLIGSNNSGEVVLIVSVDGSHTSYYSLKSSSQSLETQMIKVGKGLRGRYWQFELITQDNSTLNLDTFEFLPIVFGRKIGK